MSSLGFELPKEMARVRDEVMPAYMAIGPAGAMALAMMRADLDRATNALAQGDLVMMIRTYESLKSYALPSDLQNMAASIASQTNVTVSDVLIEAARDGLTAIRPRWEARQNKLKGE